MSPLGWLLGAVGCWLAVTFLAGAGWVLVAMSSQAADRAGEPDGPEPTNETPEAPR